MREIQLVESGKRHKLMVSDENYKEIDTNNSLTLAGILFEREKENAAFNSLTITVVSENFSHSWRPPIIWKEGINWVQMVVGIGVPVDIKDATITIGSAAKAYYLLPTNTSYPAYATYERSEGRSFLRENIYAAIEDILRRHGFNDGKSCLLKLICEYSKKETGKISLISKIIEVILRPSSTLNEAKENVYFSAEKMGLENMDCDYLFPECKNNILNTLLTEYVLT